MAIDPQITIRLPAHIKTEFEAYAIANGLDASKLAKLLIIRELRIRRLLRLKNENRAPKSERQKRGSAVESETITARFSSVTDVDGFDQYAETCDLTRQAAGAWLLDRELKDRWIEKALSRR